MRCAEFINLIFKLTPMFILYSYFHVTTYGRIAYEPLLSSGLFHFLC